MNNPWIDIASYEVKDAYRFKGRDEDIHKFLRILDEGIMSVLYANSGIGKTSFINAGIIPKLKRDNYIPIKIVFPQDFFDNEDIDNWLYNEIKNLGLNKYQDEFEWIPKKDSLHIVDEVFNNSIWWLLHTCQIQNKKTKKIYFPLIIFDQFEEVFTKPSNNLGISTKIHNKLFETISEISSNALPVNIESYLENYKEYIEVDSKHYFKIIFSLRKEYLSDFDYWTNEKNSITELYQNRMFLLPMTHKQAEEVITKQPIDLHTSTMYVETLSCVKHEILNHIDPKKKGTIEPLMLSVLCSRLFDQAQTHNSNIVNVNDLKQINLNSIIRDFYEENLKFLEEQLVILFEEKIIDENGHRNRIKASSVFKYPNEQSDSQKIPFFVQEKLESIHIIRSEKYNDEVYVELIHDKVAEVITERKKEREVKNSIQKRRKNNLKKLKFSQNVLTLKGRKIWDNKSFSFSVDNARYNSLENSSDKSSLNYEFSKLSSLDNPDLTENSLFEQLFSQVIGEDNIYLDFNKNRSKDGISRFEIKTKLSNGKRKVRDILFYSDEEISNNPPSLFFCKDGFCGISMDFDEKGNETRRKYICEGYTSIGISTIKFSYDEYGFPIKALYYDTSGNHCKHIDGNYGVRMEYDTFGNEVKRWFIDQNEHITTIYNNISGVVSRYDDKDRLIGQYFIDAFGNRMYDIYNYHGVLYKYSSDNDGIISEVWNIDTSDNLCNTPSGYAIESRTIGPNNLITSQSYLNIERQHILRIDGNYLYSSLVIEYDKLDRPCKLFIQDYRDLSTSLMIKYEYDFRGCITRTSFYNYHCNDEYKSLSNENGVHETRYEHDVHGALSSQSYWDINGNIVLDANGYSKITLGYDNIGRITHQKFFGINQNLPIFEISISYVVNNICNIVEKTYKIKTIESYEKFSQRIGKYRKKFQKEVQELLKEEKIKGTLNGKGELIYQVLDIENDYINGTPLILSKKYDDNSNLIEERILDQNYQVISDNEGCYGWRINNDPKNNIYEKIIIGETGLPSNNKYGYAIIREKNEILDGNQVTIRGYYDTDNNPVECEYGFHKQLIGPLNYGNDLFRNEKFYNLKGEPCNRINGYHEQRCDITEDDNTIIITVSFWDYVGNPTINTESNYHKCIEIHSKKNNILLSRAFYSVNGELTNTEDGFAKLLVKRYNSFNTYFYFPFCDHDVICFYDSSDNKVDVSNVVDGNYTAYKYILSTSRNIKYKIKKANSKTVYLHKKQYWKVYNVIVIPIACIILLLIYPCIVLFTKLLGWIKHITKKQNLKSNIKLARIIKIAEINVTESESLPPIKSLGIDVGAWIIKWNDWEYQNHQYIIDEFEQEFNKHAESKFIIFYNPTEADKNKQFLKIGLKSPQIGVRIVDAEVEENEVAKMLELKKKLNI